MNEMMTWVSPKCAVQHFEANDHVAICNDFTNRFYRFICEVRGSGGGYMDDQWGDLWVWNGQNENSSKDLNDYTYSGTNNMTNLTTDTDYIFGVPTTRVEVETCVGSGNNIHYIKEDDVKWGTNLWAGIFDNNGWDWGTDYESKIYIYKDNAGKYHSSYNFDTFEETVAGNFSR